MSLPDTGEAPDQVVAVRVPSNFRAWPKAMRRRFVEHALRGRIQKEYSLSLLSSH